MKILKFIFFLAFSALLIGLAYWLLGKLFIWYMGLSGFWFYFLTAWFGYLSYRFIFSNLGLFRLRKTIILFLGNSALNWARAILLTLYSVCGFVYVVNSYKLIPEYSAMQLIAYCIFILLALQLTINMVFQLADGEH